MNDTFQRDDHEDDRAIARALDADDDRTPVDPELLASYHDALAQLPVEEVTPAPGLEDRVLAAALARRPAAATDLAQARVRRRNRARLAVLGVAGAAAAIVVAVLLATGASTTRAPVGHVEPSTEHATDVAAVLHEPGARTGVFPNGLGRVALAPSGQGDLYDLARRGPIVVGLVSDHGTTTMGSATPQDGVIAFGVDHPERVTALTLILDGAEIGRAELVPAR